MLRSTSRSDSIAVVATSIHERLYMLPHQDLSSPDIDCQWHTTSEGERLDQHIKNCHPQLSQKIIKQLFDKELILLNHRVARPHTRLRPRDHLRLLDGIPQLEPTPRGDRPLRLLYLDRQVMVVDKPAGLPCHPLDPWEDDSVSHRALARCPEMAHNAVGERRAPGLLHRLDNDTSGVLCFARDTQTYEAMLQARQALLWEKWYLAWVIGRCKAPLKIVAPIAHHPKNAKKMVLCQPNSQPNSQPNTRHRGAPRAATTLVYPITTQGWSVPLGYEQATPVLCYIDTGARHQIRVHLASQGHPILGDPIYQTPCTHEKMHLHAWMLKLPSPPLTFQLTIRVSPPFPMPPFSIPWSEIS